MRTKEPQELLSSHASVEGSVMDVPGILPGSVCAQYVRCGKEPCSCREGRPHGPYHYRVWRSAGAVVKAYVKPEDVSRVVAACAAYADLSRSLRDLRRERQQLMHTLEKDL
ncbi:MAG TPA: DUF6788 family protein, partial [Capsulimonadaceae bacterium]|nr:DUF6788 family protein [Capsulimonadaceae bacterium]